MITIYLCGYFFSFFTHKKINSTIIEYADSDNPQIFSATIIRNENVYKAKHSGYISLNLHNLDVAKKNSIVCSISNKNSIEKLENDLSKINNDILAMQKKRADISIFQDDIKNADRQIKEIIEKNIYLCPQNDFSKINNFVDTLKKNLSLRNQILLTENHGNIKEMDEKKSNIENQIKKNINSICATQTGIVSYNLDGLEQMYSLDNLYKLKPQQLNIKSSAKEISQNTLVNTGDPVFKIIESNNWYLVCYIKNQFIKSLQENDSITIFIENGNEFTPLNVYIQKILPQNKNESYFVMRCSKFIHDYLQNRTVQFKLEDTNRHGFKIPVSAIDKKTLLKIPEGFIIKKADDSYEVVKKNNEHIPVTIYDSDENYYYVDAPSLKSKDVIVNSNKQYEISQAKKIRGVYLANTGIATFKKINYDDQIPAAGFIVIDPKLNPSIKIYDRIVTDIDKISDQQKIIEH